MSKPQGIDMSLPSDVVTHVVVEIRNSSGKQSSSPFHSDIAMKERVHMATGWNIIKRKKGSGEDLAILDGQKVVALYRHGHWFNVWLRETVVSGA